VKSNYLKISLTDFSKQSSDGGTQSKSTAGAMLRKARIRAAEYKSILNPSNGEWVAACESIAATMPEEYQQLIDADLKRLHDLNLSGADWDPLDHYSQEPLNRTGKPHPMGLTQRFFELVDLRIYQCPRPLALPEAFCRVFTELEPDQHLSFGHHCENCLLEHLILYYHENRRIAWRELFDQCVLCGGVVKWVGVSHYSQPCHVSEGSPFRIAMASQWPTGSDDSE
jgi:hypothetical protein